MLVTAMEPQTALFAGMPMSKFFDEPSRKKFQALSLDGNGLLR